MKLKEGFIRHEVPGDYLAVATGKAGEEFHGLVRNNGTADYIFELLMNSVQEEQIVDAVCERYHAPREQVVPDVHTFLAQVRAAGFLEEET